MNGLRIMVLSILGAQLAGTALFGMPRESSARYSSLSNSAVLVEVNGISLTKGQLEGRVGLKMAVLSERRRNVPKEKLELIRKNIFSTEYKNFIPLALFATEARSLNMVPGEGHRQTLERKYLSTFGRGAKTLDEFYSKIGRVEGEGIRSLLELDLMSQCYIQSSLATQMVVTAAAISNQVAETKLYNARAALTNAWLYAQASNVLARARSGADFSELADEYSQDDEKEPGGDLGFCAADDFSHEAPSYWESIVCLKPGEITDVMSTEDGIEIVKFLGEKEDVYGDGSTIARHLARIVWHTAIIFDTDWEFLKKELTRERRNEVIGKVVKDLMKKAKIVYPQGEDVVMPPRRGMRKR